MRDLMTRDLERHCVGCSRCQAGKSCKGFDWIEFAWTVSRRPVKVTVKPRESRSGGRKRQDCGRYASVKEHRGCGRSRIPLPGGVEFWLGAMADNKLALLSGYDRNKINRERWDRGIPSWRMKSGCLMEEEICNDLVLTLSVSQTALKFGVSKSHVYLVMKRNGLKLSHRGCR